MKLFLAVLICLITTDAGSQNSVDKYISKNQLIADLEFKKGTLYIIGRGTLSKSGLIGNNFNLTDNNLSHIGIGYIKKDKLNIFNITNEYHIDNRAIRFDSLASFIKEKDVYYLRIWLVKVSKHELKRSDNYIKKIMKQEVVFDYNFLSNNGDSLYCSEFCANMLSYINKRKFAFSLTHKEIKSELIKNIMGRTTLSYYPVDFFIENKFIRSVNAYFIRE